VRLRQRERDRERRAHQDVELTARMAEEISRLFPACPRQRAEAIAAHTALRGSGRVGRSAADRALEEDAHVSELASEPIDTAASRTEPTSVSEEAAVSAVVASVRHEDTDYDALLMAGVPREEARARIRASVDAVLDRWRA
jgi:hypothetical protein